MLDDARHPNARHQRFLCVVPYGPAVTRCAPLIEDLSAVLAGDLPLDTMQVARLHILARDGIGPLYCSERSGELASALERISARIVAED